MTQGMAEEMPQYTTALDWHSHYRVIQVQAISPATWREADPVFLCLATFKGKINAAVWITHLVTSRPYYAISVEHLPGSGRG